MRVLLTRSARSPRNSKPSARQARALDAAWHATGAASKPSPHRPGGCAVRSSPVTSVRRSTESASITVSRAKHARPLHADASRALYQVPVTCCMLCRRGSSRGALQRADRRAARGVRRKE